MHEHNLTSQNFDRKLRPELRFGHGFDHAELERAKGIMDDVVKHVGEKAKTKYGMGAEHFDIAMKYLHKDHEGWKKLPEHQKEHIETALKDHFGISEPEELKKAA